MNIKDVRIGNYLPLKDYLPTIAPMHEAVTDFVTVITIRERTNMIHWTSKTRIANVNSGYNADEIEGIPLTEEWVKRLDFKDIFDDIWCHSTDKISFDIVYTIIDHNYPEKTGWYLCYQERPAYKKIEYVHQLQNIFSDLTGEDLSIK